MSATLRIASHGYSRPVVRPLPRPTQAGSDLGIW